MGNTHAIETLARMIGLSAAADSRYVACTSKLTGRQTIIDTQYTTHADAYSMLVEFDTNNQTPILRARIQSALVVHNAR